MKIFNLFKKKSKETVVADAFRMAVRKGVEKFVTRKIWETTARGEDTEQVLPAAIELYFANIENTKEFAFINVMTLMEDTWNPYTILQEEKNRIMNMIQL